jgi:hypothetical protein
MLLTSCLSAVVASGAVPVEELFLPLLAAAYSQGVNPSLGTAVPIPLDKVRCHMVQRSRWVAYWVPTGHMCLPT